jgi:hypothetical protein
MTWLPEPAKPEAIPDPDSEWSDDERRYAIGQTSVYQIIADHRKHAEAGAVQ